MNLGDRIGDGLVPGTSPEVMRLAERLREERPQPRLAFRRQLRAMVVEQSAASPRPGHVAGSIVTFAVAGVLLLLVAAVITFV